MEMGIVATVLWGKETKHEQNPIPNRYTMAAAGISRLKLHQNAGKSCRAVLKAL